jgi:LysR family hydrogen peroxide-inducible transcriptional activator
MTLQELKYVVAVADERNFRRAADKVFVSQPSLSASVKKLEEELGVRLFERGPHEVLLTEAGRQVVEQARRVLDEAARVKVVAKEKRDPLRGALRLGVIHTIAPYLLPDLVLALRSSAPSMPLDIEENLTANLDQMLRGGLIDVAIVAEPYAASGIETVPLYDEEFRVVVPAKHPWARRRRCPPTNWNRRTCSCSPSGIAFAIRSSKPAANLRSRRRPARKATRSKPCAAWWPRGLASPCSPRPR